MRSRPRGDDLADVLLSQVFGCRCDNATPRPDGAYFIFELIWRGGIYGAVNAVLLTVLPLPDRLSSAARTARHMAAADRVLRASLALVITITAVYHLGYSQYRDDGFALPKPATRSSPRRCSSGRAPSARSPTTRRCTPAVWTIAIAQMASPHTC